jgi:AAA domain
MSIQFKKAVRENVRLLIGMAGGTGSGKTWSAMRLAKGIAGDKPFAVIDSENDRAQHYADDFRFDHASLHAPFRPDAYWDAIKTADDAGYPVIVVDSASHVWAGDGGVLDWQEEELDRMAGGDWKKREQCKMAAWIKPKLSHKQMVQKLLQVKAHLILCFRAEQKIEMVREDGKLKIVAKQSLTGLDGWIPVCEKNLPFELTASFLLTADAPGMPKPIKLQQQHKALFPLDKPINEESGRLVAEWASGGVSGAAAAHPVTTKPPMKAEALPDDGEPASPELLEQLGLAFEDKSFPDAKREELLMKISYARVKRKQEPATKWGQLTRGQIRWAIGQIK